MLARKSEDWEKLGTARCGRCAQILPDETLTYCLACGVPFSKVPPTASFHLLSEKSQHFGFWRRGLGGLGTLALSGIFIWILSALFLELRNQAFLTEFQVLRPIRVHFVDRPEYPQTTRPLVEASLAVARQSFKDHFGMELTDIRLNDGPLPGVLDFMSQAKWNFSFGALGFWTQFTGENFTGKFFKNPQNELLILVSNFPVVADPHAHETMELRHLSSEAVVSGLSHPGFVLVSSYRMNNNQESFAREGVSVRSFEEKARFLGEYVLAHELGHSLLGLEDSVYAKPHSQGLRAPAAARTYADCLMHSDEGGGFWALQQLTRRPLGAASNCREYDDVLQAFSARAEAFHLLKDGHRRQAFDKHQEALRLIQGKTQPWVKKVWEKEATLFDSSFRRWIRGMFMFQ